MHLLRGALRRRDAVEAPSSHEEDEVDELDAREGAPAPFVRQALGAVAHLEERSLRKGEVAGSSPVSSTRLFSRPAEWWRVALIDTLGSRGGSAGRELFLLLGQLAV